MELIVDLNEFSELCGVTAETMRVHIRALTDDPVWLVKRGDRGRGYEIEAEGGIAWWRAKRECDETATAERRAQLAQLRFEHLGDAAETQEQMSLSGKQRMEEYAATLKRIELRRIMGDLIERKLLVAKLSGAAVEHRRRLDLVPNEMMAMTGMSHDDAEVLRGLLAKTVDEFWREEFVPAANNSGVNA